MDRWASVTRLDLVPFKPRADVLLVGTCHAGSAPVSMSRVTLQVDDWAKSLSVYGDRSAALGADEHAALFSQMALGYERSVGGRGDKGNPVGRGLGEDGSREDAGLRPNFEHPTSAGAAQRATVPGLAPLRRDWKPRRDLLGTYDAKWKRTRWPWFPEDFDFAHFNAAPADQQRPYLRGDERLAFERLVPEMRWYRAHLPGKRVRAFRFRPESRSCARSSWRSTRCRLNADALKLVLVWRGIVPMAGGPDVARELSDLMVSEEPLSGERAPLHEFERRLRQAKAEAEAELEPPPISPPQPASECKEPSLAATKAVDLRTEIEQALQMAEVKARQAMQESGIDVDAIRPPTAEQLQQQAERLAELGIFEAPPRRAPPSRWTRERVAEAVAAGQSMASASLIGLDLSELELDGADFTQAILIRAQLSRTGLRGAKLDGANLAEAVLEGANLAGATLTGTDLSRARLTGADLGKANLDGAIAEQAVFRAAILAATSAVDLAAPRADFTDACCEGCDLSGADLSEATLDRIVLRGATLRATTLEGARGEGLDAEGADLSSVRASGVLPGARLIEAKAVESIWQDAMLDDADFTLAEFTGANFIGASLERTSFHGCRLRDAKFATRTCRRPISVWPTSRGDARGCRSALRRPAGSYAVRRRDARSAARQRQTHGRQRQAYEARGGRGWAMTAPLPDPILTPRSSNPPAAQARASSGVCSAAPTFPVSIFPVST